ncbi:MAG: glycosyltransferase family 4 protein [Planctomycetia bacterium]|nr:glycosyltransferase family 4 protein [Planctomycetia bacterium]
MGSSNDRRLLILCEHPTLLGGENSMLSTIEGVRREGFAVTIMAPPEGPLAEACAARDLALLPFRSCDFDGKRLAQSRRREYLASQIAQFRPDLLHANSLAMARLVGPVAAALDVSCLGHLRDIVKLSARAVRDLNANTRLVAVSEAARRFHVASGVSAEKTHVLYNGVDLERFQPRPASGYLHRELGLPPETRLVGVIGQIGLRKGQDVLARAARLLADRLPELHYLIVGRRWSQKDESRRFEADLRAAADAMPGRFHFLGARADVDRLLNELAMLVHPARQEPLGRVLLEAAASGVAIVATDVGGTPEIFPPSLSAARLVGPDDIEVLAEAILAVATDPALRAGLSAAARRRAETAFDHRQATENLLGHYRELTG